MTAAPRKSLTDPALPPWVETRGTVTSCRYQFARMSTFTLGIQTEKKFLITFDYRAQGQLFSDQFQSATAVPQNQKIEVFYNPLAPEENSLSYKARGNLTRSPLLLFGIAGSIVLSLLWLAVLRGCS